jgi:hypothetical protein
VRSSLGFAAIWGLLLAAGLSDMSAGAAEPAPAPAGGKSTITVLKTPHLLTDMGTIWRYYETWQSDVVRADGALVNVNVYDGRKKLPAVAGEKPAYAIKEAKRVMGSPSPPKIGASRTSTTATGSGTLARCPTTTAAWP